MLFIITILGALYAGLKSEDLSLPVVVMMIGARIGITSVVSADR